MKKLLYIVVFILISASNASAFTGEGHVNVRKATIRKGPSTKHRILDFLLQDEKISILSKKGQWYRITYVKKDKEHKGWISASLIRLIEKSNIQAEFFNISERFKKLFSDNFLFLDNQLKGYDLSKLELKISFSSETGIAKLLLIFPFNKQYYESKKTKEMSGSLIDFMVYNDYLWALVKYKKHVAESVKSESRDDYQVIMSFQTNLLLLTETGDAVILSGKLSGDYVVFNPYIDIDFKGYKPARIFSTDAESVEENSVFYLPRAKESDGRLSSVALLYNFFDLEY